MGLFWELIKNAIPGIIKFAERQGAAFLCMIVFLLFMYSIFMNSQLENARLNADVKNRLTFVEEKYYDLTKQFNQILQDQILESKTVIQSNTKALDEFNTYNRYKNPITKP